jgi:hypothetical protein
MPESVTDRPTKAHEYVFLLTKSQRYYWDQEAVKEIQVTPINDKGHHRFGKIGGKVDETPGKNRKESGEKWNNNGSGRNIRTVWQIATAPYKGAHFATWPPKLVEPMIKAGTSERGCCPTCGKAWVRVVEKTKGVSWHDHANDLEQGMSQNKPNILGGENYYRDYKPPATLGWRADCDCPEHDPIPCTILDPFAGSGTTLLVARKLGRSAIGLDLSITYLKENATKRLELDKLKAWTR